MHAVCGYSFKSTWLKAIRNNHYIGWPLLNVTNVGRHYPKTIKTPRGQLNQAPANVRLTKPKPAPFEDVSAEELAKAFNKKERDVFIKIWDVEETVHSNQIGKFWVQSQTRNKYIMIMTHIDSSAVLAEPTKKRTAKEMIRAYCALLAKLRTAGFASTKHTLNNECLAKLKEAIRETCKLQLVPPGNHRASLAEVAIKTFKQHFLSALTGTAPDFPWLYWDVILPQVLLQLNLLRKSNATPTVSAHAHLCG